MKLQSYTITQGKSRAGARSMLKAIGFTDEDLAKPIIGVRLEWIGEICVTLPRGQIERLRAKAAARSRKAARAHAGVHPREAPPKAGSK